MNTFLLKISSPDGDLLCEEVTCLNIRSTEGELAVMAGHIPFVCSIVSCDCKIEYDDGSERIGHTDGGILTVSKEKVLLLSGSFTFTE